jgi:hypothetical protein
MAPWEGDKKASICSQSSSRARSSHADGVPDYVKWLRNIRTRKARTTYTNKSQMLKLRYVAFSCVTSMHTHIMANVLNFQEVLRSSVPKFKALAKIRRCSSCLHRAVPICTLPHPLPTSPPPHSPPVPVPRPKPELVC